MDATDLLRMEVVETNETNLKLIKAPKNFLFHFLASLLFVVTQTKMESLNKISIRAPPELMLWYLCYFDFFQYK